MPRPLKAITIGFTTALFLTACGGSSSTTTPPVVTPPPTGGGGGTGGGGTDGPVTLSDLVYAQGATENGDIDLLLDIYHPSESCDANRPTILYVHGGGFTGGSKTGNGVAERSAASTDRGFNYVSINYRVAPDNPVLGSIMQPFYDGFLANPDPNVDTEIFKAALAAFEDTVVALNWLEDNANEYCLDMSRLAYWGASAGAYTVLNVGYSSDDFGLTRPDPDVVINYWGALGRTEDMAFMDAPFMTIHGDQDPTVVYQNALDLAVQADAVDVPYSFYTDVGGGHGISGSKTVNGVSLLDLTMDFIEAHIVGGTPLYETANVD